MANLYDAVNPSSSSYPDEREADDFSLLLHQIMLRSPSSSSSLMARKSKEGECFTPICNPPRNQDCGLQSLLLSASDRIPLPEVSSGGGSLQGTSDGFFGSPRTCFLETGLNVPSSSVSVGTFDNDLNEYDCENEGFEGVVDEATVKPTTVRGTFKRSRAAEVHNLSEKRRRSRINEKMKALQNLIPNSNKTDKASMLDEAIDYLKQLQLQVQLLTVRNGLNLYPMCLPGAVQPNHSGMRMGDEGNKSSRMSSASVLPVNPASPSNLLFSPPDNYINQKQASTMNLSKLNDSEHSLAPESGIHAPREVFQFHLFGSSNKGIYMEEKLHCQQLDQDILRKTSVEEYMGSEATASFTFNTRSGLEEHNLEACVLVREKSEGVVPVSQGDKVEELSID